MVAADWRAVISDAASIGIGMVQFIGGEPTLHPAFVELVGCALDHGLLVEVYSNLVHVTPAMWELFSMPGVSLATSYYSDSAPEHDAITRRSRSHERTRANLAEALGRKIPLRAGIVELADGQRSEQARLELEELGVEQIGIDRMRHVGRGQQGTAADVSQLCGHCGQGVAAVAADGSVWPCVFSRWMAVGNVLKAPLREILAGPEMNAVSADLAREFASTRPCVPKMCDPQCGPNCSPACNPTGCTPNGCNPRGHCQPKYTCGPCIPHDRNCNPDNSCRPNKCRPTQ